MKKTIVITLILILLFNALIATPIYAKSASELIGSQTALEGVQSQNAFNQYADNGTAETGVTKYGDKNTIYQNTLLAQKQDAKSGALGTSQNSYFASILATLMQAFSAIITVPLNWCAAKIAGEEGNFQIEKIIFNEYKIFDINFFSNDNGTGPLVGFTIKLKQAVASWYYGMRTLAIVVSLCVLIYIAIRMAMSTIASDKAKYKKMLQSWIASLVILFLLHYLIMLMVYISDALVDMFKNVKGNLGFENNLRKTLSNDIYSGWQSFGVSLLLLMFTIFQLKFFIIYFRRTVVAAFLIVVAPLITVTYSIDKVADNKAQAFGNWMSEMITIALIQPVHALLFIIFVFSAGKIAEFSILVALLLLWALSKGEDILRNIFKLNSSISVNSLEKTKLFGGGK